jgi:hypothetical protein
LQTFTAIDGATIYLKNGAEFESHGLIRFSGISIRPGKTVVSATVTMTFTSWYGNLPPRPATT